MKTSLFIILFFLLISCGQTAIKTGLSDNPTTDTIPSRLDRWLGFYDLELSDFTDSLPLVERKTISFNYDYLSDKRNLFNDFFVFSPDSLHFIDLDSYSIILEKDSLEKLFSIGSEVDTETALVDIKGKRRIRILFCGTECRPEEAHWIKNNLVYILGFTKSNNMEYPTIWSYEINNNFFQEIRTKKAVALTERNYNEKVRLKMINFKK